MWGIGASLDVEDEEGEITDSGFKDSVSSLIVWPTKACWILT
jgi:hypothetical protein